MALYKFRIIIIIILNADAVSVYCVLALYVPPYIIKLSSMVYVYPENRDPTDFGMGTPEGLIRPCARVCHQHTAATDAHRQL